MASPKNFKMPTDVIDESSKINYKSSPLESAATLVTRLPGIVTNRGFSFGKLNKSVIQALKELTDLIEDMKGNIIPRHEMLLTLHKVVGSLSSMIDINNIDLNNLDDDEEEEEDANVPKEVQDWIHYTFMGQEEVAFRKSSLKPAQSINVQEITKESTRTKYSTAKIDEINPVPIEALELLENDKLWYFNIFDLDAVCDGHTLKVELNYFFQKYNFYNIFKIPPRAFNALLNHIEFGYERNNNPYHNILHGADVLQSIHSLLKLTNIVTYLSPLELFSSLFAAAIHDYDHQGVTNNFIVENRYQLAMTYNDFSVQENHHVSAAFKLMKKPFLNIASGMTQTQFTEFRTMCIKMVLATDMCQHFIQVKKFNNHIQNKETIKIHDYLAVLLHTADLSNPAKEWKLHVKWVVFIFREFFSQGDRERALGITISPLCDRNVVNIYQSQIGFIDFIIQPTFDLFSNISEAVLAQLNTKETIKANLLKRVKSTAGISNLVMQFKHCNNRPWETCIMENRSNWRRKQDKDYNEMKEILDVPEPKSRCTFEIEKINVIT